MALFDNPGANTMILTGLGLMGPNPFAGAQRGLMQGAQLGAQAAAEKRAEAQAQRQQTEFERIQAERKAQEAFLMGGGISGAPGPQFASAGTQPAPGAPINLLPVGGAGGASIPARNTMLAGLGMNQQQAANLARMGSGAWPIIQMMQAQKERQARLNQPGKLTQIEQLQNYRARLPEGDPRRAEVDARIQRMGQAPSTNVKVDTGLKLSPFQEKLDERFSDVYADWTAGGGFADAANNLNQIRTAIRRLREDGTLSGDMMSRMPEWARSLWGQEGLDLQQTVEQVVQRNLREVLGAQFAEKEGERLIARAYDPRLPEEYNIARLEALADTMEQGLRANEAAARYVEENDTLKGYKGPRLVKVGDFYQAMDAAEEGAREQSSGSQSGQNAPEVGTEDGGYIFQGGNPGDPNNWKRVQ